MPLLNIKRQASNLKYPQKQQVIYVLLLQSVEVTQWWVAIARWGFPKNLKPQKPHCMGSNHFMLYTCQVGSGKVVWLQGAN